MNVCRSAPDHLLQHFVWRKIRPPEPQSGGGDHWRAAHPTIAGNERGHAQSHQALDSMNRRTDPPRWIFATIHQGEPKVYQFPRRLHRFAQFCQIDNCLDSCVDNIFDGSGVARGSDPER
jgi:hypothetical protein